MKAGTGRLPLDDGDRNFNKGVISNRIDLLSEVDVTPVTSVVIRG